MRRILLILLSVVVGFALDAGVTYWFATTPQGQGMLRDFLVQQTKKSATFTSPNATSTPLYQQRTLPVPQTYATYDYFLAINNVINDLALLNNANIELGPVLVSLNEQTLSCSYKDFYDLMGQARKAANKNQALIAQFALHLSTLATANVQTKDAITKSQTQALVVAGQGLSGALDTYASSVQDLLYGDLPTSAQIAELQSQVNAATGASQSFADALKPLIQHIGEGDQAVINAASSTPAKK